MHTSFNLLISHKKFAKFSYPFVDIFNDMLTQSFPSPKVSNKLSQ